MNDIPQYLTSPSGYANIACFTGVAYKMSLQGQIFLRYGFDSECGVVGADLNLNNIKQIRFIECLILNIPNYPL